MGCFSYLFLLVVTLAAVQCTATLAKINVVSSLANKNDINTQEILIDFYKSTGGT